MSDRSRDKSPSRKKRDRSRERSPDRRHSRSHARPRSRRKSPKRDRGRNDRSRSRSPRRRRDRDRSRSPHKKDDAKSKEPPPNEKYNTCTYCTVPFIRGTVPSEDEEKMDESPEIPKRQPLSLEDMIAKKEAETQAQAKVLLI